MLKKCGKGKATFGITVDHSFSNCPKITLAVENSKEKLQLSCITSIRLIDTIKI